MSLIFTPEKSKKSRAVTLLFKLLSFLTLMVSVYGAIIMTEAGQVINLPSNWVFSFYYYRIPVSIGICAAFVLLIILHFLTRIAKIWIAVIYFLTIILCLFFINSFAPDYWLRSQQHNAMYISLEEADTLLKDDTDVFVLDINGVARAYPKNWMHLPHFAGDSFGGEEATVAYCVLSNLPLAFSSLIEGEPTDYKVIAQVHNNLVFTDRKSGDLIQQITGIAEYSQKELKQYPIQRMPYASFRKLYPNGRVFQDQTYNLLDNFTTKLFDRELEKHYNGKPIFPTLRLNDQRLAHEEQIYGLRIGGEHLAITRQYLEATPLTNTELGGKAIVVAWFGEFETLGVFFRETENGPIEVTDISPYGETATGKLERVLIYPGVFWMVWSHWFPETSVLN